MRATSWVHFGEPKLTPYLRAHVRTRARSRSFRGQRLSLRSATSGPSRCQTETWASCKCATSDGPAPVPGRRSSLVLWIGGGNAPPMAADLRGCRVLAQGLTVVRVFTEGGAQIIGSAPDTVPVDGLTSVFRDHGVGTRTHVWGWMALTRCVERELAAAS